MTRYKKLSIKKGPKRIAITRKGVDVARTYFCPECGKRVRTIRSQKPQRPYAYICDKKDLHKSGLEYLFPLDFVRVHQSVEAN